MNPAARSYPEEFIQTGVSAIDGLNTLVRGQKLPIFSASVCLMHSLQRRLRDRQRYAVQENFAVVFAAIGVLLRNQLFRRKF